MKTFIIAMILLISLNHNLFAETQSAPLVQTSCVSQAPFGFPQTTHIGVTICRHAYITSVDTAAKIPIWVIYTLTPAHALGCLPRSNAFATDQSLPQGSATPNDYDGSGYDKGHNANDGDMSFDTQAETESFLMTNMSPQLPGLNRGIWKLLETSVRGWVVELNQPFTIYIGNLYGAEDKTIGKGVVVPHALFKIVVNDVTGETAGWLFPQSGQLGSDLTKFRTPISQIEQESGITFEFPPNYKELPTGTEWKVDFGQLTKLKHQKCSATIPPK